MLQKKNFGNDAPLLGFIAQTATADVTGATCDLLEHDSCLIVVNVGNSADTLSGTVYMELEVEDSPDNSTWTDCTDALITNAVTGTNTGTFAVINDPAEDSAVFTAAYLGRQRYVRVVYNTTGTHTSGTPVSATYIRSRDKYS